MSEGYLIRAALGNVAALGDLYDARTDNFLNISIFKNKIPEEAISLTDNPYSNVHLAHSDSYSERFSNLDVHGELKASVLTKLFNLGGLGSYLNYKKTSARIIQCSLLCKIKTKEERLNIYHQDLNTIFAHEAVDSGLATHVVIGISWGANSILSFDYQNNENQDETKTYLLSQAKDISSSILGNASVEPKEVGEKKVCHFDFQMYGDILLKNNEGLPISFDEALNFIKQMPSRIAEFNQGRGKQLSYTLIPLSLLQDNFKFSLKSDKMNQSLKDGIVQKIFNVYENIHSTKREINIFYEDVKNHNFCVKKEDVKMIEKIKEDFEIQELNFCFDLGSKVTALRSGRGEESDVQRLITSYLSGDLSPEKVSAKLKSLNHISEKISFADSLRSVGAIYLPHGSSLESLISHDARTYIFYFNEKSKTSQVKEWTRNKQRFLQEMKKRKERNLFLIVDCDVHPELWPEIGMSISVFENYEIVVEDLLYYREATANNAYARCLLQMTRTISKPNNRVHLVVQCTGNKCKPGTLYKWICPKCSNPIDYGFNDKLYCSCGYGDANSYEFKCTDKNHGSEYDCHEDKKFFTDLLSQLRLQKEMNILIIGETGVGKSTFINAFKNYLNYSNLEEAEKNELYCLIPSQFTAYDENYEDIIVSTGQMSKDTNEIFTTGQSATQQSKVYGFVIGDTKLRLIDTPGVGDNRGIDQDKINFENILMTLSYLDELHGICILLKPNNSRINVIFNFCINELLTHLHKDASKNIMFCFTNSRGTSYGPGDTLSILKKVLSSNKSVEIPTSKDTLYFFDNEAYRFLAGINNKTKPVIYSDFDRKNFSESWKRSITETKRMMQHIASLIPHPIKNTTSLNDARNHVQKLPRPIVEISKNIQINREFLKECVNEIIKTETNIKNLKKEKSIKKVELEVIEIEYPKVVCTNTSCKKISEMQTYYPTSCDEYGNGQNNSVFGELLFLCSWKVSTCFQGTCRYCLHQYKEHIIVYYETKEVEKEYEDMEVTKMLNSELSEVEKKKMLIDLKIREITELDEELKFIEDCSRKFAYFLKQNCITPFNDEVLYYINILINDEENKVKNGESNKSLQILLNSRQSYTENIETLSKEMEKGDSLSEVTIAEIYSIVEKLCKLKHSGNHIKTCLNAETLTQKKCAIYQETFSATNLKEKYLKFTDWLSVKYKECFA